MSASAVMATPASIPLHPNEVDRRRIERAIETRKRYRYVTPEVLPCNDGYLIKSSCCSRNVDPHGGVIDIARIEYRAETRCWRLYRKDHGIDHWIMYGEYPSLPELIGLLNEDANRRFWQ